MSGRRAPADRARAIDDGFDALAKITFRFQVDIYLTEQPHDGTEYQINDTRECKSGPSWGCSEGYYNTLFLKSLKRCWSAKL